MATREGIPGPYRHRLFLGFEPGRRPRLHLNGEPRCPSSCSSPARLPWTLRPVSTEKIDRPMSGRLSSPGFAIPLPPTACLAEGAGGSHLPRMRWWTRFVALVGVLLVPAYFFAASLAARRLGPKGMWRISGAIATAFLLVLYTFVLNDPYWRASGSRWLVFAGSALLVGGIFVSGTSWVLRRAGRPGPSDHQGTRRAEEE